MQKFIVAVVLAVFALAVTPSCKKENKSGDDFLTYLFLFLILNNQSAGFIDNKNGTLSLYTTDPSNSVYHVKKCLQGQVYRSAENDCRGVGSSADGWGASKLQYCSTDTSACNPAGQYPNYGTEYVYGQNSEIYVSCSNDTTAGLTWYPLSVSSYGTLNYARHNSDLPSDISTTGIWEPSQYSYSYAVYAYQASGSTAFRTTGYTFKTSRKYTLCGSWIPN